MSKASFREDLIKFLVESSQTPEEYYGYINPHLIAEIVSALSVTTEEDEPELDSLRDWADNYWSW